MLQATVRNWLPDILHVTRTAQEQPVQAPPPIRVAQSTARPLPVPAQVSNAPPKLPAPKSIPVKPQRAQATLITPPDNSGPKPEVQTDNADVQAVSVAQRLRASVPSDLFPYFDVYLYVSKAASGPWAQHMFVFHKSASGQLIYEESFPVSTGRERQEKYFTSTPSGLFELDPDRFDANHRSHRWNNAPMPWAMFLNYTIDNHATGVALHSGVGHVALLGQRASGGCVRMPPEKAEEYFHRFQATERGQVPVFAFDASRGTTRTDGAILLDAGGRPLLTDGYKVLLIIQDYPGGPVTVAAVS
ncbi:MAG TPA: L,D-transpeptidase [Rhizomicrobium sp.]|nr:L,D-transpeptidase [Rhizomicrobium sp.]